MKKFILPLLLLLAIGMLAAVESEPSAVVGYFKKTVTDGGWQAISLPFAYTDLSVGSVLGDQFMEPDAIVDINLGSATTYWDGYGWDGELTDVEYGAGYYLNRVSGNGSNTYYLMGTVNPQGFSKLILGNGAYTAFGMNDAAPVAIAVEASPFGANPVDGDFVTEIDTGLSTTYWDGYGWDGELAELQPTYAYYYTTTVGGTSFNWVYTPTRSTVQHSATKSMNGKKK